MPLSRIFRAFKGTDNSASQSEINTLTRELEETRREVEKEKKVQEEFMKKEQETKTELEFLQKYSNPETLSSAKIASQVRASIKNKSRQDLEQEHEELQVAYTHTSSSLLSELQEERDKFNLLQQAHTATKDAYLDIHSRYEKDVTFFNQQAQMHQAEMESQRTQFLEQEHEKQQMVYDHVKASFNKELQEEKEKAILFKQKLEEATDAYHDIIRKHRNYMAHVTQWAETLHVQGSKTQLMAELMNEAAKNERLQDELQRMNLTFKDMERTFDCAQKQLIAENQLEKDKNTQAMMHMAGLYETLQLEIQLKAKLKTDFDHLQDANARIQEQIKNLQVSHHDMKQRYETKIKTSKQQIEALTLRVQQEQTYNQCTINNGLQVISDLRAEIDKLRLRVEANKLQRIPRQHSSTGEEEDNSMEWS
ncbi:uncharacterized protein V6R79_004078 [Siganus canaliculatus]